MQVSARSYLTAGIAVIGAGAMALTPVAPLPQSPALSPAVSTSLAVNLAASIDPITPWIDTFQASADNIVGLFNAWAERPFPIIQQVIANQLTYLGELPDIGSIISQVVGNVGNAITAPFVQDLDTLSEAADFIWIVLPQFVELPEILNPVLDWTTNYSSGVLFGLVSPLIAPVVALGNSLVTAWNALTDSDIAGALNELINIPAHMVNAFLNGGQVLNLTPLLDLIGGVEGINELGIALGGLLSPATSIFNTLDLVAELPPFPPLHFAGTPGGPLGSLIGLTQFFANSIAVEPVTPAASVRAAAAVEASADEEPAAVAYTAVEAAPEDAVTVGIEPETAPADDVVTLEATTEAPATEAGAGPIRRGGHDSGIRAGRGAAQPAAAASADDAPKASSGKGRASRG